MTECNVTCDDCGQDSIPKVWHCPDNWRLLVAIGKAARAAS